MNDEKPKTDIEAIREKLDNLNIEMINYRLQHIELPSRYVSNKFGLWRYTEDNKGMDLIWRDPRTLKGDSE